MKLKKDITSSKRIHVFGLSNTTSCSKEEYELIFNKNFDISNISNDEFKSLLFTDANQDKVINLVLKTLKKYNYKDVYLKLVTDISTTLFIASNPIYCFALSSTENNFFEDMVNRLGTDLLDGVSAGAIKGVLIVTALRLFVEYTRGGSKYKFFDIIKQCLIVLLIIVVLPTLPGIVTLVVDKYLTY